MDRDTASRIAETALEPWRDREGGLIMVLHHVQNHCGYVPRDVALEVARLLELPLARIYEVVTFYNYFKTEAPGKHVISICMGTACYLKGAPEILRAFQDALGIETGQSTPDRRFHLQVVRCLGCCGLAPVMTIGERVFGRVTPEQVKGIVAEYSQAEPMLA